MSSYLNLRKITSTAMARIVWRRRVRRQGDNLIIQKRNDGTSKQARAAVETERREQC